MVKAPRKDWDYEIEKYGRAVEFRLTKLKEVFTEAEGRRNRATNQSW